MSNPQPTQASRRAIHHKILIIGGGSAGISVAARLRRAGENDVAVIEPSANHYFQPSWTLVGGGACRAETSVRPTKRVIPNGVQWIQDRVATIDAEGQKIATESSVEIGYDFLVAAPGIQLDWDRIPGLREALKTPDASSNYALLQARRVGSKSTRTHSVTRSIRDYTKKPTPTIPLINTMKERYDMWLLKKYGLPWFYWNLMLKGRA